ncbi:hypothetical protein pb186bvf_015543 [Paramecium bursaria]
MSKQNSDHKLRKEESRLMMLENNLNRVCLQQDALMPLLQVIEYIPQLQKFDNQIKGMQRKQEELETALKDKSNSASTNTSFSEFKNAVKSKPIEKQIGELGCKIVQIDNQVTLMTQNDENVRDQFQQEFKNIYKEINGLRCDMEYLLNNQKKQKITQKLQQLNYSNEEKLYLLNILELETFIEDLDHYENENSFRILYEIEYVQQQREFIKQLPQDEQEREQQYLEEKVISLKYQLSASKKKYYIETKKIDHKYQIVQELPSQYQQQINNLYQRYKRIIPRIQQNIENICQKIKLLDLK